MAVDEKLFMYNLAVVSIMKNEAPYVKEWLDYHILAGVQHFYIYDNESPDNLKEVLQPYIDKEIVTYKFYPGKARQYEAYNEAFQEYKFFCKYIAFIDADEFIFPQNGKNIVEVVDEVLDNKPRAGALVANIYYFGSNNLETADYSKGVLERFTRRAPIDWKPLIGKDNNLPGGTCHVSTITNPRRVDHFGNPHYAFYFDGYYAVNTEGQVVPFFYNDPPLVDKMVMNHYSVKSKEEYMIKISRGTADNKRNIYNLEKFEKDDHNEVFDDSILKYRDSRKEIILESVEDKRHRIYNILLKKLSPFFGKAPSPKVFTGKLEDFLICFKLSSYLREKLLNEIAGRFFEEISLTAINKALSKTLTISDIRLLIDELPKILKMDYMVVQDIKESCFRVIPKFMEILKTPQSANWREFVKLQYLLEMLKLFPSSKN